MSFEKSDMERMGQDPEFREATWKTAGEREWAFKDIYESLTEFHKTLSPGSEQYSMNVMVLTVVGLVLGEITARKKEARPVGPRSRATANEPLPAYMLN